MEHLLEYELILPVPREEVFNFFSDAANLRRITPPELHLTILTPLPIEMKSGALIEYQLGLLGVSFGWTTLISTWEPPHRFVDEQLKGPYSLWIHTHTFEELPDQKGTRIHDHVRYRLPLSPLGDMALPMVQRQLKKIFDHRQKVVMEHFSVTL